MTVELHLQTALKIAASNLYIKITLVWLDSSLSAIPVQSNIIMHMTMRAGMTSY